MPATLSRALRRIALEARGLPSQPCLGVGLATLANASRTGIASQQEAGEL